MEIISIDKSNIDDEHICCAIGADKQNSGRAKTKKEWMKNCFSDGLVFKKSDERGKAFIEYMPVEKVWKPIIGKNYFVINCLWVSGKFKGRGLSVELLEDCIKDAREFKKDGIAVVTSTKTKPFLTDKKFYLKQGFVTVDTAFPYFELMVLKFNKKAENPVFTENAGKGICSNENGFTFIFSNQCPFMEEYADIYSGMLIKRGIPFEIRKLNNFTEAQQYGSPFGTFGIYYNGKFLIHELLVTGRFEKLIDSVIK